MRLFKSELPGLVAFGTAFFTIVAVTTGAIAAEGSSEAAEVGVQILEGSLTDIDTWVFDPSAVEARVGDSIVWTNMGALEHTVTARHFDSRTLAPGASFSWTATDVGQIPYVCDFHTWMTGTIVVSE